jgi:hypothetical protein
MFTKISNRERESLELTQLKVSMRGLLRQSIHHSSISIKMMHRILDSFSKVLRLVAV